MINLESKLQACKAAAKSLRSSTVDKRNAVLLTAAKLLQKSTDAILNANHEDLAALTAEHSSAFRDRLTLNEARIQAMGEGLQQVASFSDPLSGEVESRVLSNGLKVRRVRSPLGVILMIFESRPNVAVESFSLAFKSGNVILLRGGKESMRTVDAIYRVLSLALRENGFDENSFLGITDPDRKLSLALLQQRHLIDVVVPRGGDKLIDFVVENSKIPIIKNDRGMCHVFVNEDADLKMAEEIVFNAKTQRPGVCNAMETLLVHEKISGVFLHRLYVRLKTKGVQWRACPKSLAILEGREGVVAARDADFDTEWLDLVMNCKVVTGIGDAINHIEIHGSKHSEAIVTGSQDQARRFESEVDAAAVYWNASTRFTDGYELGLGGELGISTQKLHVRGPVGLKELTSVRWILEGNGQIRK